MSEIAIRVEKLSKRYTLGGRHEPYRTLRESMMRALGTPWRRLRSLAGSNPAAPDQIWALNDVSFEVRRGEVIGIIGRNGAGKSTLLKVLSRISEPTSGYAEVRGRVGSLLEMGTGFHPELTGRENVYLCGSILGMRRAEIVRKFDEIVAFAEVERFLDTPVKHYSSGMYLRLAFAVAAHLEPEILVVDEVLAVGDAMFQIKCLSKMQEVGQSGRTVLFVSHDLTTILRLAPTSLLLDQGRVHFWGPTADAIEQYSRQQQQQQQLSDLRERTDRTGDGLIRIESLRLCNAEQQPIDSLGSGEPLSVVLGYSSQLPALQPEDLMLDMRFNDALGHPIATVSTRFSRLKTAGALDGQGYLVCHIPSLALAAETYGIDLWLAYRGGLADYILRAGEIQVVPSNYYGAGQEPVKRKHGATLLQHSWSFQDDLPSPQLALLPQQSQLERRNDA